MAQLAGKIALPSLMVLLQMLLVVVAVRAAYVGGQRYEEKGNNGIHQLMARLLPRATKFRSRQEVAALTERIVERVNSRSDKGSAFRA